MAKPAPPLKTYLNLPADLVRRADALAAARNAEGGPRWTRTAVIEEALRRYLAAEATK